MSGVLRLAPIVTLILMLGPVLAGLLGTVLPAFGYLPSLGGDSFGLSAFAELLATPGIRVSIRLSWVTGFAATACSLLIVVLFCAAWHGTVWFTRLERLLSPLLSVPHVAVAFGLAFLIAPSGWIMRLLSPWATGYTQPPDVAIIHDPWGLSLIFGLVLKEVPFLLLMTIAALGQVDGLKTRLTAMTLGYGAMAGWLKTVLPQIYPLIRLPVLAVLAFSISVVDMAMVLAPTTPPPLSVLLLRWMNDPDLSLRFVASAGGMVQLLLVLAAIAVWLLLERLVAVAGAYWTAAGQRGIRDGWIRGVTGIGAGSLVVVTSAGLVVLAIWSFAGYWRFPDALPDGWSLRGWQRLDGQLLTPLATSAWVAFAATVAAILLVLLCLENEAENRSFGNRIGSAQPQWLRRAVLLLYLPLLVPQVTFLFGMQVLLISAGLYGSAISLVWAHMIFVLPYVFLSLGDTYRHWDERYKRTGLCLGRAPVSIWLRIKLPMLLRPILVAMAVGFAVSIGQYLPTILIGGGRFTTLTTEAVSLAAGSNRRLIGVYSLLQVVLPMLGFLIAMLLPLVLFRNRRGLQVNR